MATSIIGIESIMKGCFIMFGVSEEKIQKWAQKGKINKVLKAADNSKVNIRKAAITALGELDFEESFHKLVSTLRDPDPEIRGLAAKALGVQAKPLAIEHLRYVATNDDDKDVRNIATEALKMVDVPQEEEKI